MTKPTILQTLLGRPSQTYTFPQDRDYHSTKAHMLRVASAAQKTSDLPEHQTIPTTVMGRKNRLSTTAEIVSVESHVIDSKLCLDGQLDDKDSGSEEDIFYTPDTSPMPPLVNQLDLPPNVDNDSAIATRTPFTPRSTTTSISSNSLDGHSIFSLDSSPLSDSTFITTPNVSDTGHDIDYVTKSARRSNPDRSKQPSLTYTDEDWAKDVRWLAPPSAKISTKRKSKPSANNNTVASTSYYIAQLPPKIVPQPPLPRPRPRPKIRSKSVGITAHYSIMSSMTALLEEEDEDRESAHHPSQGSLRSAAAVAASPSERLRTHSSSSSARPRPSNSLRRQNNLSTKPLSRRKSRSLEHLPPITSARRPLPDSVHSLSSFASSTSYVPSIPSSGTPGYTSLTLPRAPQPAFTPNPSKRVSVVGGADGKIDLTRSGIAQTTMATVEVTKGLAGNMKSGVFGLGNLLNRARSRSVSAAKGSVTVSPLDELGTTASSRFRSGKAGVDAVLNFTSYRRPPDYIPGGGRSFVGRVLECGWDVSEDVVRKGEWVVGLLEVRKCGALQEFIVADRHRVHRIPHPTIPFVSPLADSVSEFSETPLPPTRGAKHSHQQASSSSASASHLSSHSRSNSSPSRASSLSRPGRPPNLNLDPPPLTLEEYALLPLCGIFAYRAVRTLAYAFGKPMPSSAEPGNFSPSPRRINEHEEGSRRRRALVLRGHDGVGAIAVQMLVKRGWRVCVHASFLRDPELVEEGSREERVYMESVERRVRRWGAEEVVFDDGGGSDPEGGGGGCEDGVAAVVREGKKYGKPRKDY
ncbi:acyl- dehydrogenase [Lentinula edodes]|uniref:Acyl-dehydrogenase n=1 Tax=Lentinula edodes TaxID=5353 RepID=A0A1Q3E4K6_LENED|nr:acyl- dehydrogenase [Lentinula edodes]